MGPGELNSLLQASRAGDAAALDQVFAALYADLKMLARAQLSHGRRPGQTLQTTVLVHEAYLRLAEPSGLAAEDRAHFLNLAARVMRHVIVDLARRRDALKRGMELRVSWPEGFEPAAAEAGCEPMAIALHDALARLEQESPRLAQLVELRFFGGLGLNEIAELLDVSDRTLKRDWRRARAFLLAELA
jgi:RNA polymerase sigma factor (TIGR02999 family)